MEIAVVSHRGVRRYPTRYGDLAELAGRFAAELERREIHAGERVVLWGGNSVEWIGTFFGCLLRGVLVVPLDASGSREFAQRVLADVTPKLIVGDAVLLCTLNTDVPKIRLSTISEELPSKINFAVDSSLQADAPFQIIFTSGTTSEPKGIVHTHRNVLASLRPIETEIAKYRRYERWVHPLRFLHTLPLSHVFGQFMGLWIPALLAVELHFVEDVGAGRIIDLIRTERISVLIAVPRVLALLRIHLLRSFPALASELEQARSLAAWRRWWGFRQVHRAIGWKFWAIVSGGASLPAELEQFWNRLGFALIQGYGMTETTALVTLNHPFRIGQGTIGKALPGREVRLGNSGEILVRGDMVSSATWQHGRMMRRDDEWLATGDLAERSASGDFRFLGRKGDAIVAASGLNIYPSDLEAAMQSQTGVRACAVVPCEVDGRIEPVCVVLFSGDDTTLQATARNANQSLMEYQHIRRTLRWPDVEFPYTSTGKLLRRELRNWACAILRDQGTNHVRPSDSLITLIAEITGFTGTQDGDELRLSEDLYLDSLGRIQLASALEQRLGVELDDEQIAGLSTLGDLRKALGVQESMATASTSVPSETLTAERQIKGDSHNYPYWPWSWPIQRLRSVFREIIERPLIRLLLAPSVVYRGTTIPPGPLLIVANHVMILDAPLVLYALPGRLRRCLAIAMSGEMLLDFRRGRGQNRFMQGLFARIAYWLVTALFNVFPLPRLKGFKQSFAHAGEAMNRGYSVLIFPEGARSRDQQIKPFRQGIGLLAAQSRVPVLPIALVGLENLRPGKRHWFRTGRLQVRIGDLVMLTEGSTAAEWTEALETAVRRLQDENVS